MAHRWLIRALIFLLLGAVVNVALTWLLALVDPRDQTLVYYFDDGSRRWGLGHTTGLGMDQYDLYSDYDGFVIGTSMSSFGRPGGTSELTHRDVPGWARWRGAPGQNHVEFTLAFGWPFRCLVSGAVQPKQPPPLITRWGVLPVIPSGPHVFRGTVPLVPMWPGLLANTLFYAVVLWLLWTTPFAARRFVRIKRDRCPKCGYDLQGGGHEQCPECGAAVKKRAPEASTA